MEVYRHSDVTLGGHMTSSLQVKMARCDWINHNDNKEKEYFSQVIKEKKGTS